MNVDVSGFVAGQPVRGKWMMDGAVTLAAAAERLRIHAVALQTLHDAGWTFAGPVEDDYGFLVDPAGNTGEAEEDE